MNCSGFRLKRYFGHENWKSNSNSTCNLSSDEIRRLSYKAKSSWVVFHEIIPNSLVVHILFFCITASLNDPVSVEDLVTTICENKRETTKKKKKCTKTTKSWATISLRQQHSKNKSGHFSALFPAIHLHNQKISRTNCKELYFFWCFLQFTALLNLTPMYKICEMLNKFLESHYKMRMLWENWFRISVRIWTSLIFTVWIKKNTKKKPNWMLK